MFGLEHPDVEIKENIDLAEYSTFKLSAKSSLAIVSSIEGLKALGKEIKKNNIQHFMLGLGANLIVGQDTEGILFIKLKFKFKKIYFDTVRETYNLPASITLNQLTRHAIENNLKGWEVFTGIPATLGGAIYMNAGTILGEMKEIVAEVTVLRNFEDVIKVPIDETSFSYRQNNFLKEDDVIIAAKLKHFGQIEGVGEEIKAYLNKRNNSQPMWSKNCGCVYKNNSTDFRAGLHIDLLGLKQLSTGPVEVSKKHANFFENTNNASFEDVMQLNELINCYSNRFYGSKFELEPKVV